MRRATRKRHDEVDALYGALDLTEKNEFARFLTAHYVAIRTLYPLASEYIARELEMVPPGFIGMLEQDLRAVGVEPGTIPALHPVEPGGDAAGITYVIAGSRLGLTVLRQGGYWQQHEGTAASYMEDESGLLLWRALLDWMGRQPHDEEREYDACAAADSAFALFAQAHALSSQLFQD